MKILWIYPELPYPLTSGYLRGFNLLREFGRRKHSIVFLCLTHQWPVPQETAPELKAYAKRVEIISTNMAPHPHWLNFMRRLPVIGWRLQHRFETRWAVNELRKEAQKSLAEDELDVVLFTGRETLPVLRGIDLPIVVECGDTHCEMILQQIRHASIVRLPRLYLRYLRIRRLELKLASRSPQRYFISLRDREKLLGPADRSSIVPQGVDCDYWRRSTAPSRQNCIVFSGVMSYPPNADAAMFLVRLILPLVRNACPELRVLIVGRDPLPELLQAAEHYPDVTITGKVKDVRPFLERADIYVAPLRFASGVQNKVLEAMAMEVPVVTTPVVAAGLCMNGATPLIAIAQDENKIADCIIRLLGDAEERDHMSLNGREFVEKRCSWKNSADELEKICSFAASTRANRQTQAA